MYASAIHLRIHTFRVTTRFVNHYTTENTVVRRKVFLKKICYWEKEFLLATLLVPGDHPQNVVKITLVKSCENQTMHWLDKTFTVFSLFNEDGFACIIKTVWSVKTSLTISVQSSEVCRWSGVHFRMIGPEGSDRRFLRKMGEITKFDMQMTRDIKRTKEFWL